MLILVIYFLSVLNAVQGFLFYWISLCGFAAIVLFVFTAITSSDFEYIYHDDPIYTNEKGEKYVKWVRTNGSSFNPVTFGKLYKQLLDKFKYWLIIPLLVYSLAPNERTQYIMLGAYIGQESIQMIENSTIMQKVGTLIETKIDHYLIQDKQEEHEEKKSNSKSSNEEKK